jgi:hypothetical protein
MQLQRTLPLVRVVVALFVVGAFAILPAVAMSVRAPTFTELVGKAESIVYVTVEGTRSQWDTTPTGQRVIHTYVDCRVHDAIKGAATDRIELRFLGGDVGSDHLVIADMPKLAVGAEYVLFVAGNKQAFCPLVHVMHGCYPVIADAQNGERRVTRHDREPLQRVADVARPFAVTTFAATETALTLAQFRAAIVAEQNANGMSHAR